MSDIPETSDKQFKSAIPAKLLALSYRQSLNANTLDRL
jgi:hypothetical protein